MKLVQVRCPRCGQQVPASRLSCPHCSMPLDRARASLVCSLAGAILGALIAFAALLVLEKSSEESSVPLLATIFLCLIGGALGGMLGHSWSSS